LFVVAAITFQAIHGIERAPSLFLFEALPVMTLEPAWGNKERITYSFSYDDFFSIFFSSYE
jgi:hypothetical protein